MKHSSRVTCYRLFPEDKPLVEEPVYKSEVGNAQQLWLTCSGVCCTFRLPNKDSRRVVITVHSICIEQYCDNVYCSNFGKPNPIQNNPSAMKNTKTKEEKKKTYRLSDIVCRLAQHMVILILIHQRIG